MKITKTSVCVLLITFLIGYASVPPEQTKQIVREIPGSNVSPVSPDATAAATPSFCAKDGLETVEEIENDFDVEEKYPFRIRLLETGDAFHGAEVPAKDGETWLGLFRQENGGHALRPAKLKIRRVYDIMDDAEKYPQRKTGKSVEVNDENKPLFLLKNAEKLPAGETATLFRGVTYEEVVENTGEMALLTNGFFQEYEIGGKKYTLEVKIAKIKTGEKVLALILEGDGKRQILHTKNAAYTESLGALLWVGDLDRDRKPDFYMELYVHENAESKNLFFSAPAAKDKLVKRVANFRITGC